MMDPVFVIAIFTVLGIIAAGLLGGVMSRGHNDGHHPSLVSRILDWMF